MRVSKKHDVRLNEIMDASELLFTSKGYEQTTINDILAKVEIGKGTFYHYFKSKEEVMDAIIMRIVNADAAAAKAIADNPALPAIPKLFQILFAGKPKSGGQKEKMLEQFHKPNNAEMHQRSLVQSILHLTPVLTQVVEQGIREKVMATDYPQEAIEFLLVSAQTVFDEGLFHWEADKTDRKIKAFISIMESVLGAKEGSFKEMKDVLSQ